MRSQVLYLARLLMIEQRYRAVKKSDTPSSGKGKNLSLKKLHNFLRVSYVSNSVSFALFSLLLIIPYIYYGTSPLRVADIGFIVYIYALIISIYSSLLFFNSIRSMSLLDPVLSLPYSGKNIAVFLSWLIYSGSGALFVVLPPLLLESYVEGNPLVVAMGLVWAFILMLLGYSAGALMNVYVSGRMNSDRASFYNTMKTSLRVILILAVFTVFEAVIYLPGAVPQIIPPLSFPLNAIIPLFNIPYVVFLGNFSLSGMVSNIGVTMIYMGGFLMLTTTSNTLAVGRISRSGGGDTLKAANRAAKFRPGGYIKSIFMKDARIVARNSQNVILLFIPVIFVFPTIISILIYGSGEGIADLGTYFSLTSVLIVCAGFYSLIFVVSEGEGIRTLASLPMSFRDIVYSKALLGIVVFSMIIVPVTAIVVSSGSGNITDDILVPANLIIGYSYASVFNIRRLLRKLPSDVETVNFYSFGGGVSIALTFAITTAVILAPIFISLLVSDALSGIVHSGNYIFYLTDSFVSLAALLLIGYINARPSGRKGPWTYP